MHKNNFLKKCYNDYCKNGLTNMYPCDPISFNYMKIRGEASYYYAEIKEFVKHFLYAYWLC